MAAKLGIQPSLETIQEVIAAGRNLPNPPNLVPVSWTISGEVLTPSSIYLKITNQSEYKLSFLFESASTTETIGRFSFVGAGPRKVLLTGEGHGPEEDPLPRLDAELSKSRVASIPGLHLPPLTGGAIGYVGYDCVKYFEPKTKRDLKDVLKVPESLFMFFDTVIAVDHFFQVVKVITYIQIPEREEDMEDAYDHARMELQRVVKILKSKDTPELPQPPVKMGQKYESNIGQSGYESHVHALREHIVKGDIIQAVPSQRKARPTSLHPFNVYRQLRIVNPSPYLFYIDCDSLQIVGASPELLVKAEAGRIITHPIAGTVKRGNTGYEDAFLAAELKASLKDRAEHIMLVDLARNDINRVCDPRSTRVDRLMVVQKFSHVQHLTSEVSGELREGKTRFDAFKSIFPAGTVSGAPKVRAMELIAELEGEKRGVYAGAVGYFGYGAVDTSTGKLEEGAMDTCIALRTMVIKDGVAYLQAGGGIVYDSDPTDEYEETENKLRANMHCIALAEAKHLEEQADLARVEGESGRNGLGLDISRSGVLRKPSDNGVAA
ncbi:putative anthranilate synthase component I [Aulographum hederae CBS 113979]|uniref:anthranilate synthase n=1 Tax=Aulographum hederae CBS 113979 TaxID=1176131 RepID=A0A6G1HE57_9PEZI|nr:putative anthranilate synthase component I [Aulographum hederae CBS 113979]